MDLNTSVDNVFFSTHEYDSHEELRDSVAGDYHVEFKNVVRQSEFAFTATIFGRWGAVKEVLEIIGYEV